MMFIHVGMHKTGTSFMQRNVFPGFSGINYIPWPNLEYFLRLKPEQNYLVSREGFFNRIWATHDERLGSLRELARIFPDARLLISFRRHAAYIESAYREYLHQGGTLRLDQFFDFRNDSGLLKVEDQYYRLRLEAIEQCFGRSPFVFLHEEVSGDLPGLLRDLGAYLGAVPPQMSDISPAQRNKGVGFHAGRLLRRLNELSRSELNPDGRFDWSNPVSRRLQLTPDSICRRWLGFLPDRPFIAPGIKAEIDRHFASDWELVVRRRDERGRLPGLASG